MDEEPSRWEILSPLTPDACFSKLREAVISPSVFWSASNVVGEITPDGGYLHRRDYTRTNAANVMRLSLAPGEGGGTRLICTGLHPASPIPVVVLALIGAVIAAGFFVAGVVRLIFTGADTLGGIAFSLLAVMVMLGAAFAALQYSPPDSERDFLLAFICRVVGGRVAETPPSA